MRATRRWWGPAAFAGLLVIGCGARVPSTDPRMIAEWMHTYYGLVRAERLTPPVASRLLGYASVALYEGLAAASPGLQSLAGLLNGLDSVPRPDPGQEYDATFVAVAAEHAVLDSLFEEALPTTRATLAGLVDSLEQARADLGVNDAVQARSRDLGMLIGNTIVAWARGDGFDTTRTLPYVPPVGRGLWVNDAPGSIYSTQNVSAATSSVELDNPDNTLQPGAASDRALILNRPKPADSRSMQALNPAGATEPYWGSLRPFVLQRWDECTIEPPPPYATDPTSEFYRENQEVWEESHRTNDDHRTIAYYWADNPGETGTPAGHWLAIASQMVSQLRLPADRAARLFVLSAVTQADAFLAAFGYKYHFNLIRPRTYIRRVIDPSWEPLIPTPPFPEYPSAHSTQSGAAAAVMTALLGAVAFEDSTGLAIGHSVRRFESFDAAAEEAGWSRIYGGIHYHIGKSAGKALGTCIGGKAVERLVDGLK